MRDETYGMSIIGLAAGMWILHAISFGAVFIRSSPLMTVENAVVTPLVQTVVQTVEQENLTIIANR